MEWYFPITILPALGLMILSTANFLVALNNEILQIEKDGKWDEWVIQQKINQLKKLGIANALFYASAMFFLLSALSKFFTESSLLFNILMVLATVLMTTALIVLLIHSLKAISIREKSMRKKN